MAKLIVISTVDFPSEWYVAGISTSPEAALNALRQHWEEASEKHQSNPNYRDWKLVPQKNGLPMISAINPRNGQEYQWSLEEYEVWDSAPMQNPLA